MKQIHHHYDQLGNKTRIEEVVIDDGVIVTKNYIHVPVARADTPTHFGYIYSKELLSRIYDDMLDRLSGNKPIFGQLCDERYSETKKNGCLLYLTDVSHIVREVHWDDDTLSVCCEALDGMQYGYLLVEFLNLSCFSFFASFNGLGTANYKDNNIVIGNNYRLLNVSLYMDAIPARPMADDDGKVTNG